MQIIDELLFRLHELGDCFSAEEKPTFSAGASPQAITALQGCVSQPLPDDFASFLHRCDSIVAMNVWNGLWIGGIVSLERSIKRNDFPKMLNRERNQIELVPVATDGGGNAFLMALSDRSVWKWNHESNDCTLVADDFSGFLKRIIDDWEHYLAGDFVWNYLT
jgi:hypothetical protein